MDNINTLRLSLVLLVMILLAGTLNVSAYGVGIPYWDGNPLRVLPGESKDAVFVLGPSKGQTSEEKVMVSLIEGSEIAQVTSGSEYTVIPGGTEPEIILRVSIPSSDPLGKEYKVRLSLVSTSGEGSGTVQLGVGYGVEFPILVGEEEKKVEKISAETGNQPVVTETTEVGGKKNTAANIFIGIIVMLIIIVICFVIYMLLRKRNS